MDPKKVLIVEDEIEFAEMVKLRLELENFICDTAYTTDEGIEAILDTSYDLIILDLMMPGGGGFTILEKMRINSYKSHVPVIILTGKTITTEIKALIGRYQVSAVFTKPYDPLEFVSKAKELME